MTDYTIISRFRNKERCEYLVGELKRRGKTCYSFCETPADPDRPEAPAEEQMEQFEQTDDFYNDKYFQYIFQKDLDGLKNAQNVILLLPAGTSAHIEAGIAYGLGKHLILIGQPAKPESLYLIFQEGYDTIEDFLRSIA